MKISISRSPGVYIIKCLKNGKFYIGSSVNLRVRFNEHRNELRKGSHHNHHLQAAWNKYGENKFEFKVLEYCERNMTLIREQFFLDALHAYERGVGFNIARDSSAPTLGRKASIETRAKLSQKRRQRKLTPETILKSAIARSGVKRTPEQCARIAEGIKKHPRVNRKRSIATIEKSAEPLRKEYIVTSPIGIEIPIKGIVKFCRENGLDAGKMVMVAQGQRPHHKGWKCRKL